MELQVGSPERSLLPLGRGCRDGFVDLLEKIEPERLKLGRNFLHAARLEFTHPFTAKALELEAPLPSELNEFLGRINES